MTRAGQVWTGPLIDDPEGPGTFLVLRRNGANAGTWFVLNLETGRTKDMYLKGIEEDTNWRRIA